MIAVSLLDPVSIRRLAVITFAGALLGVVLTFFMGAEVKGAHRWLYIAGLSLQPSEFVKPAFAVGAAWLFAEWRDGTGFPGSDRKSTRLNSSRQCATRMHSSA